MLDLQNFPDRLYLCDIIPRIKNFSIYVQINFIGNNVLKIIDINEYYIMRSKN